MRFSCTRCGDCCRTHGEYRWVFVDAFEIARLAVARRMSVDDFVARFCERHDDSFVLRWVDDHCVFLTDEGCGVYGARPDQCRTWPFWPEVLASRRVWDSEVAAFCPGVGQGRLVQLGEIRKISRGDH